MKIILLFLIFSNSYAFEYLSILPQLKKDQTLITLSSGLYSLEKTYEKDAQLLDLTNQEGYLQTINYQKAFSDRLSYEIEFKVLVAGEYTETYSGNLSYIEDKRDNSHGASEPTFKAYYWFNDPRENFHHALFASLRPKLVEPKAHQFYNGRNEIKLSYLYLYQHKHIEVSGEIFSTLFGKKEIVLDSGAEDTIESFTEVGFRFNPGIILEKFSLHLLSSYSSMTDYNTSNKYFERNSDKGYAVEIGARANWKYSKNKGLTFSYLERESYFNSIEEDVSRNIEFEIDSEEYMLSWWILL
ncbi:hypothetical protein [Halobacteriovorax sp.]|uniref:hypothetical protein n=1 Tax=Halobacteriovorax sp. TaxID=2020862 RepID=UPI0035641E1A